MESLLTMADSGDEIPAVQPQRPNQRYDEFVGGESTGGSARHF